MKSSFATSICPSGLPCAAGSVPWPTTPAVALGAVMRSLATGRVVASRAAGYRAGDLVTGWLGWQEYACVRPQAIQRKLPASGLPISTSLGVLGLNGLTAYFGLLDIGRPQAVGIAGGATKTQLCTEVFGYDAAIGYKADDLDRALAAACPRGVDIYFDNTAGAISDAVLRAPRGGRSRHRLRHGIPWRAGARCPRGRAWSATCWSSAHRCMALLVMDHEARYPDAIEELSQWVSAGRLRYREDIQDGIEQAPGAIAGLYRGENLASGSSVCNTPPPETSRADTAASFRHVSQVRHVSCSIRAAQAG